MGLPKTYQGLLLDFLPFPPTRGQAIALGMIETFLTSANTQDFFVLKGAAGTGKTSLVKAITEYLSSLEINYVLCAPTAQAARIIGIKTNRLARTIHSTIYTAKPLEKSSGIKLRLKPNTEEAITVFIIDEASMVSGMVGDNQKFIATRPLLSDFIDFVKEGNQANKIIFIGDVYQLPPVKETFSPALATAWLEKEYALSGDEYSLNEVKRQGEASYVLKNAIGLRESLENGSPPPPMQYISFHSRKQALQHFCERLSVEQFDQAVMIAHTNKDVNRLNDEVRKMIFREPGKLQRGDLVLLHANWSGHSRFLLKGDTAVVTDVSPDSEQVEGLHFTTAELKFYSPEEGTFHLTTKVLLECLSSHRGDLDYEQEQALFAYAMKHNKKFRKSRQIWDDEWLGAMRLRYAYALTCHRAQGGEWDEVLLHANIPRNDLRWQYTAVTRARNELYLIGR